MFFPYHSHLPFVLAVAVAAATGAVVVGGGCVVLVVVLVVLVVFLLSLLCLCLPVICIDNLSEILICAICSRTTSPYLSGIF